MLHFALHDILFGYCAVYTLHLMLMALFCRWASLADAHGDKLAAIDPHQSPATKLTYLCVKWGLLVLLAFPCFYISKCQGYFAILLSDCTHAPNVGQGAGVSNYSIRSRSAVTELKSRREGEH